MKKRTLIAFGGLIGILGITLVWGIFQVPAHDPLFHGKPESEWIALLPFAHPLDRQVHQWREFGPEGVRVLVRGLQRADRRWVRAWRKTYGNVEPKIPDFLRRALPEPLMDTTRETRARAVYLLSRSEAEPEFVARTLGRSLRDEYLAVRQYAISYFTRGEGPDAPLNQMDERQKEKLLHRFVALMEDENMGMRSHAAIALRYYPECREIVVPVLLQALEDPSPLVRLIAAESLNRVSPGAIEQAGILPVVIEVLSDPSNQVASRAARLLGTIGGDEPELVVSALIEAAQHRSVLVAEEALRSLGNFPDHADEIVPVLVQAMESPAFNIRWAATNALERISPEHIVRKAPAKSGRSRRAPGRRHSGIEGSNRGCCKGLTL